MESPEENRRRWDFKKILGIILVCLLIGGGIFLLTNKSGGREEERDAEEFATKFLKLEGTNNNIIYSPLSVKYALSILRDGSFGETKDEIETALSDDTLMTYENVPEKLSIANAVLVSDENDGYISEDFLSVLSGRYSGEVLYKNSSDLGLINDWAREKSFGRIKELEVELSDGAEMVVASLNMIQMNWIYEFSCGTEAKDFYAKDGAAIKTPMVRHCGTFSDSVGYYEDADLKVATLGLERQEDGTSLEFVVVMPKQVSLEEYAKTASASDILRMTERVKYASSTENGVSLAMPRFRIDYELSLVDDLKKMGIEKAFSAEEADFSQMMARRSLYVSNVIHKAEIEFSEQGLKSDSGAGSRVAPAVTLTEEPVQIVIDQPFMFLIYDKKTKEVWFVGAVYVPEVFKE